MPADPPHAAPQARFEALAESLAGEPGVGRGRPFRGAALTVDEKIFAMIPEGRLVLKLPHSRCAELADSGAGQPLSMGTRTMREWISIDPDCGEDWHALATEALAYVRTVRARRGRAKRAPS
ncbi:MAG TPA: TfoX/Sxy family protein [Conexibacter sp.]|jgi:TfoX/Sxy family transcriptional regulator of competence genes